MSAVAATNFDTNYELHQKHLKLKGLQPKTIEAYSRAIRRVGDYFDHQIDDLTEADLLDYFTDLRETHSWSSVKLDLSGLKFYHEHVLKKPWVAPGLIKPPRSQRLPDIVTVEETERSAWETVHRFSQNGRRLQGTPGAIAVLHTHSRRLDFHPHVHLFVPAAAVDAAKQRWRRKRRGKNGTYLFNEKAMAKVFRAKMLAAIEAAGICLPARYPRTGWHTANRWVAATRP